jgi:predicted secreted protein
MKYLLPGLLLFFPFQAFAHDTESHYDRVHLSASAEQQIENDTIIATLYAEEEGSNPTQLADLVNKKIEWAAKRVKKHKDIKLQTNSYSTNPVYNKNKISRWRVRQSIRLESRNMAKVSELLGLLQDKLALQGMQFAVSSELKTKTDDSLIADALSAFENRANQVAKQLKRKSYKIVDINISTSGNARQHNLNVRSAMMESVSAPTVEAGEQTVQVTVSGSVELE